jgi:predicted PurR-regulated permease PerM
LYAVTAGGLGAILAVPLTMLLLIILENIDGTRTLSVLTRFTGKEETDP